MVTSGVAPGFSLMTRGLGRSLLERDPDTLIDEARRIGLLPIERRRIKSLACHHVGERFPARLAHRADALRGRIAAIDNAVGFDLRDRIGEKIVGLLGIVALDQRVSWGRVAVEIAVPTLDTGINETLH